MKKVKIKTDPQTGKITFVCISTSSIWYCVSPEYVKENKERCGEFKDAYKLIKDMEK